jgi:hypothetical protein
MAERGAPLGNQNAAKAKVIADGLRKLLTQQPEKLEKGLQAQVDAFAAGELPSAIFVRDTLDGKPAQAITNEDGTQLFSGITITVVHGTAQTPGSE